MDGQYVAHVIAGMSLPTNELEEDLAELRPV